MPEGIHTNRSPVNLLPTTPALSDWHSRGLCVGEDPDLFFPSHGDPGTKAREICTACVVRAQCLQYAIQADEFGIWGGLDQAERQNMRRRQRRAQAAIRGQWRVRKGN
jgi:hypothetical protein